MRSYIKLLSTASHDLSPDNAFDLRMGYKLNLSILHIQYTTYCDNSAFSKNNSLVANVGSALFYTTSHQFEESYGLTLSLTTHIEHVYNDVNKCINKHELRYQLDFSITENLSRLRSGAHGTDRFHYRRTLLRLIYLPSSKVHVLTSLLSLPIPSSIRSTEVEVTEEASYDALYDLTP